MYIHRDIYIYPSLHFPVLGSFKCNNCNVGWHYITIIHSCSFEFLLFRFFGEFYSVYTVVIPTQSCARVYLSRCNACTGGERVSERLRNRLYGRTTARYTYTLHTYTSILYIQFIRFSKINLPKHFS